MSVAQGLNMKGSLLKNVGDPVSAGDAVNLGCLEGLADGVSIETRYDSKLQIATTGFTDYFTGGSGVPLGLSLDPLAFDASNGMIQLQDSLQLEALNVHTITGLNDPIQPTDVVTKRFLDAYVNGVRILASADVATNGPIDLTNSLEGLLLDGETLSPGMRILVKNQANAIDNGIYDVIPGAAPARSDDFSINMSCAGTAVFVVGGTKNGGNTFSVLNIDGDDVIETDPIRFSQSAATGQIRPGAGLIQQGPDFAINVDPSSLEIVGDVLRLRADQPRIRSLGNVTNLTIQNQVIAGTAPTQANHLANKGYVDGMSYLSLGSGIIRDDDGSIAVSPSLSFAHLEVSESLTVTGQIECFTSPTQGSHVANKSYISSLQWLTVDASLVKDTASQILRISAFQPSIVQVGVLQSLSVAGPITANTAATLDTHVVTKGYVDGLTWLPGAVGRGLTFSSGKVNLNDTQAFTNLTVSYNVVSPTAPTLTTHLANKEYVDNAIANRAIPYAVYVTAKKATGTSIVTYATRQTQSTSFSSHIQYEKSAADGDQWTILTEGIYAISAHFRMTTAGLFSLMKDEVFPLFQGSSGLCNISFTGYLEPGAVFHVGVSSPIDSTGVSSLFITKL